MKPAAILLLLVAMAGPSCALAEGAQSRLLKGNPPAKGKTAQLPDILVEIDQQQAGLDKRKTAKAGDPAAPPLPFRVYLHNFTADGRWYYVLTNFEGSYPKDPPEWIRIGSVLSGKLLGAKNPEQRYLLNRQAIWVPTFRKEAHYFWMNDRVPRIKQVEFGALLEMPK